MIQRYFRRQWDDIIQELNAIGFVPENPLVLFNPSDWHQEWLEMVEPAIGVFLFQAAIDEVSFLERKSSVIRSKSWKDVLEKLRMKLPQRIRNAVDNTLKTIMSQEYWTGINDVTYDSLGEQIAEGLKEGDSLSDMVKRLRSHSKDISKDRAILIARTESTGALNAGHDVVRRELAAGGINILKEWWSIVDMRRRPTHAALHGVKVEADANFNVGGFEAPYPGHYSLPARERVSCRCVTTSVTEFTDQES